ncbi:hypothetical protein C8Q76DRAFT_851734 [Earliella scabrosa]|nr:hypothetical protein C8Q76DRAFT_851734 [Earliella scabrosa]
MSFYISFTMASLMTFLPGLPVLTTAVPVLTVSIAIIILGIPLTSLVRNVPKAYGFIFAVCELQDSLKASQKEVAALKAERDAAVVERDEAGTVSALRVTIARLESEAEAARIEAATAAVTVQQLKTALAGSVLEKESIITQKDAAIAGQKAAIEDPTTARRHLQASYRGRPDEGHSLHS